MHALGSSLRLVSMGISTFFRIVHVLPDISFLLLPFGHILVLVCRGIAQLWLWLGGFHSAAHLVDRLCGLSFAWSLSPLTYPSAFLLGTAVARQGGGGPRMQRYSSVSRIIMQVMTMLFLSKDMN